MQRILLICLIGFAGISLKSQTGFDSLQSVWLDQNQSDSVRARAYRNYIWNGFLFSNPDTAYVMAEELLAFGLDNDNPTAQTLAYKIQGVSYHVRGNYPEALGFYDRSLAIDEEIDNNKGIAATLNNIGLIYANQGDYPKALEKYCRSLEIEEQIGNQSGISLSLNNIGIIYNNMRDYSMALDYFNRSMEIKEELGDKKGLAATLNNIGIIYQDQGNFPEALECHTRSLEIKEEIGDRMGIAPSLHNIGIVYDSQGDYPKALDYYTRSLDIKEEIGDQRGIAQSLSNIGMVHLKLGNYSSALEYCKRSYDLSLAVGALAMQKDGCNCLYDTYKAMGNGIKALEYHEILINVEDSLQAEETAIKLQQMEFQKVMFQDSLTKAEEARLVQEVHKEEIRQKNRNKNIFLACGVILVFVSFGLWWGLQFVRRSRKEIALEKEKSDTLLLNILPEEIAEELKQTGKARPRIYENVSILFTDFVDFTKISRQMSPDELVTEINACYKSFDRIIERQVAEKIKTIGDAYMAVDGFGKESGQAAKNMVLIALDIIRFTTKRQKENEDSGKPFFTIRAGLHTGDVIAGIVGEKKFQFDIWGDAVNTASRMEAHGEVGKLNISQTTYELIKDDPQFEFENRGTIKVKGKGEMQMWFVKLHN